jgi:hypothetical protein
LVVYDTFLIQLFSPLFVHQASSLSTCCFVDREEEQECGKEKKRNEDKHSNLLIDQLCHQYRVALNADQTRNGSEIIVPATGLGLNTAINNTNDVKGIVQYDSAVNTCDRLICVCSDRLIKLKRYSKTMKPKTPIM